MTSTHQQIISNVRILYIVQDVIFISLLYYFRILWIKHQRHVKKCSDVSIKRILDRYCENTLKKVEIPESEELIIPEPQGIQNLDEIPDDSEIEKHTPKAEIFKLEQSKKIEKDDEDDMIPKVEELE